MIENKNGSIDGIIPIRASVENGYGTGVLAVAGADSITWQAPGDSQAGTAVTIANGHVVQAFGYNSTTKYIYVKRNTSDDLDTTQSIIITTNGISSTYDRMLDVQGAIEVAMQAVRAKQGDEEIQRQRLKDLYDEFNRLARQYYRETGRTPQVAGMRINWK